MPAFFQHARLRIFFCCPGIGCRFAFPIFGYEAFSCSLPCWRIRPFPWAPLHNLLSFINPEVVSIFLKHPSQALYWYDQFCFHFSLSYAESDSASYLCFVRET